VAAVFFLSLLVAVVYWAARRGKINAFGGLARGVRRLCDPIMIPFERRVVRFGGNPQDAPIWLVGIVGALGLFLLALTQWLVGTAYYVEALSHGGFREWARFVADLAYFLLTTAIIVRVIGSWIGMGRYNRVTRLAYFLTDWIVEPIRRMLPPYGVIDLSPLVAYFALFLTHWAVLRILGTLP
jgi:YggT family protein